ncbi:MAG: 7TM diverse intracellular signaling domain-containing protein [Reichenbachiella sp.]|uniref:7TM diverse intracellular signaling domain-containing protein n=1 Tax=Reichenbachiella sp. TaxID=2184521 RepID=UPI0032642C1A
MKREIVILVFGLGIFFNSLCSYSQEIIDVGEEVIENPIGQRTTHFYDSSRGMGYQEIKGKTFIALDARVPNFGYNTGADWLKFTLFNSSEQVVEKILRIDKPIIDSLELYYESNGVMKRQITGAMVLKSQKYEHSKSNYFQIALSARDTITYFLRVTGMHSKQVSIHVNNDYEYSTYEQGVTLTIGFYFGALLIITLYNLFLGLTVKDPLYLFYALSNLGALLATLALKGFFTGYIFPNNPEAILIVVPVCIISFTLFSSCFCIRMVSIRKYSALTYYLFIGVIVFGVIAVVYPYSMTQMGFHSTYMPLSIGTFVFTIIAWVSGVIAVRNGNKNAKYYLAGWTIGLIGALQYALLLNGFLPLNFFTENLYLIGSVIEVLTLSFGLAGRYNAIQLERNELKRNLRHREGDLEMVISDNRYRHQFKKNMLEKVQEINHASMERMPSKLNSFVTSLKMQLETEDKLNYFQDKIERINAEFEAKLKERCPELTPGEIEICYLIKVNLSNKEIAGLRKTSEGAIKVARHRIKKKMNVSSLEEVEITLQNTEA